MRALCDAVIVGAGTVAADDPQLTTRHVEGSSPLRVVLDARLQLSPRSRLAATAQQKTGNGPATPEALRRAIQAVCEQRDPGDLTTIEDPSALQQVKELVSPKVSG